MIDEDIAAHALRFAGSKYAPVLVEIRLEETDTRTLAVKSGQMSYVSRSSDAGMNVRIVLKSGMGFASANGISKKTGEMLVEKAMRQARNARRKTELSIPPERAIDTKWEVGQRRSLVDVSLDEKLDFLAGIDNQVMSVGAKVQGRYYEFKDYETEGVFVNSEGARIRSFLPRTKLESHNMVSAKGDSAQSLREWGASGGWERALEWSVPRVLRDEVRMLKEMLEKGRKIKPGRMDLVCGPNVSGIAAHESCGHPMEADRILGREMSQAGKSFVTPEMIGQRIGSRYATVIDDPTVPNSYGYYAYDHEGVKARPRYLYKEGIINEFLHNRETASRLGMSSNGSSRSEFYLREPIVRMANTFVAPGDYEEDEMVGSIKEGVLMKSFTEWNIDDKRYNQKYVSREAYQIRDGEIVAPVKRCVLEITTPGFWGAVDAVSKKVEFTSAECGKGDPMQAMAVLTGGPMMRLRGVNLR